jgi:hypothetical protein
VARWSAGQPAFPVANVKGLSLSNHTGHVRTLKDHTYAS